MKYQKFILAAFTKNFPIMGITWATWLRFRPVTSQLNLEQGARGGKLPFTVHGTLEPRNTLFHELFVCVVLTKDIYSIG